MSIEKKTISSVTINGKNSAFGGYVYSVNYQVEFGTAPSSLTITLISEDGNYNISEGDLRTFGTPDIINIGNVKPLRMYPVSFKKLISTSGKILELTYYDTSIAHLDKRVVLLEDINARRQAIQGNNHIILLGKKYTVETNTVGNVEIKTAILENPNLSYVNLPSVLYTGKELLDGIASSGIRFTQRFRNILSTDYRQNYVGTLRDVLLAWSDDLGFIFFWNEFDQLDAIDSTSPSQIDFNKIQNQKPIDDTDEVSLIGTINKGSSSFFGVNGQFTTNTNESFFNGYFLRINIPYVSFGIPEAPNQVIIDNLTKAAMLGEEAFVLAVIVFVFDGNQYVINNICSNAIQVTDADRRRAVAQAVDLELSDVGLMVSVENYIGVAEFYEKFRAYGEHINRYYQRRMSYDTYVRYSWETSFPWFNYGFRALLTNLGVALSRVPNLNRNASIKNVLDLLNVDLSDIGAPDEISEILNSITESDDENVERGLGVGIYEAEPGWIFPDGISNFQSQIALINPGSYGYFIDNPLKQGDRLLASTSQINNNFKEIINQIQLPPNRPSLRIQGSNTRDIGGFDPRRLNSEITLAQSGNVEKIDYSIKEFSEEDIVLFGGPFANNQTRLRAAHQQLNQNLTYSINTPFRKKTFKLSGIPNLDVSILDGLESISIEANDSGIFTTYQFGNNRVKIPSEEIIRQQYESFQYVRFIGSFNSRLRQTGLTRK